MLSQLLLNHLLSSFQNFMAISYLLSSILSLFLTYGPSKKIIFPAIFNCKSSNPLFVSKTNEWSGETVRNLKLFSFSGSIFPSSCLVEILGSSISHYKLSFFFCCVYSSSDIWPIAPITLHIPPIHLSQVPLFLRASEACA